MTRSRWSWSRTIAATGVGALALGALASVGAAVSPSGTPAAAKQYPPQKGTLCHHTHSKKHPFVTITVSQRAFPAHLRHGDTIGPCAPTPTSTAAKAAKKTKASHGKSSSPGKTGEHGKRDNAPGHSATTPARAVSPPAEPESSRGRSGTAPRPHAGTRRHPARARRDSAGPERPPSRRKRHPAGARRHAARAGRHPAGPRQGQVSARASLRRGLQHSSIRTHFEERDLEALERAPCRPRGGCGQETQPVARRGARIEGVLVRPERDHDPLLTLLVEEPDQAAEPGAVPHPWEVLVSDDLQAEVVLLFVRLDRVHTREHVTSDA